MQGASRSATSSTPVVGRRGEIARIDELLASARDGHGAVRVLRGPAGIGKSALLAYATRAATGFDVVAACGAEFEADLPFAGLHQLCVPLLSHLADLPTRHRDALRVAFGLDSGTPEVFRVGLATLELLAAAAGGPPLLCVIDDAHWLDTASSQALAFLARRITVEPIAVLFAIRTPCPADELDRLPGLVLEGLSDADARTLLATHRHVTLDDQVRERILAEARGHPLALLELPSAGGFAPPDPSSVETRIERGFSDRLSTLPDGATMLLIIASTDPTGDPGLLWPAAHLLGIDVATSSAAATATGLVEFGTRIRFCHPLARSAVYRVADAEQRRNAHRVLAEVTDPIADLDRQVWHRAQAASGPDDDVAAELERCAARAKARGGVVAASAFAARAAELSLDSAHRIDRTLLAVQAHLDAGTIDTAADLLNTVDNVDMDTRRNAHVDQLRGRIAFLRHNDDNGPNLMLRAAQRLAEVDPEQSRDTLLDALEMSMVVGRAHGVVNRVLDAAQFSAPASRAPDALDALAVLSEHGHRAAAPLLRTALDGGDEPLWIRRPALAVMIAGELWDQHVHAEIVDWLLKTGRQSGSPMTLRLGLAQATSRAVLTGDLAAAIAAVAEEEAIADATGAIPLDYPQLQLAAMRGHREAALPLFVEATQAATASGSGQLIANVRWAEAVLHNGLADYPAALTAAQQASAHGDLLLAGLALPELVEAAVRCGKGDVATAALDSLTERTLAAGTESGLGIAAYARGLVTGAEEHYVEAIEHLNESPLLPYRGRAHLLYGQWLRRAGRRRDCRLHLRTAHELLSGAGIDAFAQRAADELRATGEKARSRSGHAQDQLTSQELHIARLVATGATSNEVAARLFISPRTVDTHLRNIFRKLGISSRRQLRDRSDLGS
ncbi:LuxR family transcriptional regulator [Rhodococcus sp. G-MC3]|uniref:helix-turn-helix transcriptional regulator n=1 Tax=Rhodococcus sp. G-MC3 TaxID=3046209 RepID=UPI0024B9C7EB|nr:LuxR family transcriptional regulator [Rhodococcus sp. G-MC3]MDJ0396511.1 LuxR family transcriptional regulator [Rhodococcus sp. G-MC3]